MGRKKKKRSSAIRDDGYVSDDDPPKKKAKSNASSIEIDSGNDNEKSAITTKEEGKEKRNNSRRQRSRRYKRKNERMKSKRKKKKVPSLSPEAVDGGDDVAAGAVFEGGESEEGRVVDSCGDNNEKCPSKTYQTWFDDRLWMVEQSKDVEGNGERQWTCRLHWVEEGEKKEDDGEYEGMKEDEESIERLSKELGEIKDKMWPLSISCSKSMNKREKRAKKKTSPREIFNCVRNECNPYEVLGSIQSLKLRRYRYINRSAIKLANIDSLLKFSLTKVLGDEKENSACFRFVDLCGAPGGFSEYIMTRFLSKYYSPLSDDAIPRKCPPKCRGYGMSLTGENGHGYGTRWRLNHVKSIFNTFIKTNQQNQQDPDEFLDYDDIMKYAICNGTDHTGDIYNWDNIMHLRNTILSHCESTHTPSDTIVGVADLVLADGGFDLQRDTSDQETLTNQIIINQTSSMFTLLKKGGTFIIKMFGFQTTVSKLILEHLSSSFQTIMAIKPLTSRPASSERYVVARGYLGFSSGVHFTSRDVFLWRQKLLSITDSPPSTENGTSPTTPQNKLLHSYFRFVDRQILRLNIRACNRIVTNLKNKTKAVQPQQQLPLHGDGNINIHHFKQIWNIF